MTTTSSFSTRMSTVSKALFCMLIFSTLASDQVQLGKKCGSLSKIKKDEDGQLGYKEFDGITACCNLDLAELTSQNMIDKFEKIPEFIKSSEILGKIYLPHEVPAYHWTTFDITTKDKFGSNQEIGGKSSDAAYTEMLKHGLSWSSPDWTTVAKNIQDQNFTPELQLLSPDYHPERATYVKGQLIDTQAGSGKCLHLGNGIFLNETSIKLEGQAIKDGKRFSRRTRPQKDGKDEKADVYKNEEYAQYKDGSHDAEIEKIAQYAYGHAQNDSGREWHMTIGYAHSPALIDMRCKRLGRLAVENEFRALTAAGKKADDVIAKREFEALVVGHEFFADKRECSDLDEFAGELSATWGMVGPITRRTHLKFLSDKFYQECEQLRALINDAFDQCKQGIPLKENRLTIFKDMSVFYAWNGHYEETPFCEVDGASYKEIERKWRMADDATSETSTTASGPSSADHSEAEETHEQIKSRAKLQRQICKQYAAHCVKSAVYPKRVVRVW